MVFINVGRFGVLRMMGVDEEEGVMMRRMYITRDEVFVAIEFRRL